MASSNNDNILVRLEHWQTIELLSIIIAKAKKKRLSKSYLSNFLSQELTLYQTSAQISILMTNIFTSFYNLTISQLMSLRKQGSGISKFEILHGELETLIYNTMRTEQQPITNSSVSFFEDYINKGNKNKKVRPYLIIGKEIISSPKQDLENTQWWLYFSDREDKSKGSDRNKIGVTRGVITFGFFGKVEITHFSVASNKIEYYVGGYQEHPNNQSFLFLRMKLIGNPRKDLIMNFHTEGNTYEQIGLLLGQFQNIGKSVYSGTVIIEKINSILNQRQILQATKFYAHKSESSIKSHIWNYFENRNLNVIRSPRGLISVTDLVKWQEEQSLKNQISSQ